MASKLVTRPRSGTQGRPGPPASGSAVQRNGGCYSYLSVVRCLDRHVGPPQLGDLMSGGSAAVESGKQLRDEVVAIGEALGLVAATEVKVGRRIWGSRRSIDVVLSQPDTGLRIPHPSSNSETLPLLSTPPTGGQ